MMISNEIEGNHKESSELLRSDNYGEEEKISFAPNIDSNEIEKKNKSKQFSYNIDRLFSKSSFSFIYLATTKETGETVAIKKTLLQKNYKNRELDIFREMKHPNIINLRHYFYTKEIKEEMTTEIYLNLVMDYIPETLQKMIGYYTQIENGIPKILIKIFAYQIFRALSYLHSKDICHRNIKPANMLINPINYRLFLCDFGSSKKIVKGQKNLSKICSRSYRAPEIIEGTGEYNTKIDIWSAGCVMIEMILGEPLFQSHSDQDHLFAIYTILGENLNINNSPELKEVKDKKIRGKGLGSVFKNQQVDINLLDLFLKIMKINPTDRLNALEVLSHQYFDEIRDKAIVSKLVGIDLTHLFVFSEKETAHSSFDKKLIPSWVEL